MTETEMRPAVTVIGSLEAYASGEWLVSVDELPDGHPFRDGDEVDVTIRRREPSLAREEA